MQRRVLLQGCGLAISGNLAGCSTEPVGTEELNPKLKIASRVEDTDEGWKLTADFAVSIESLHDVILLAYTDTGERACRKEIGDFIVPGIPGGEEKTITTTCNKFPAIITASATETPCEGARIETQYWVGTAEQQGADHPDDAIVWEDTFQKCRENLPSERILEKVNASETADSA